MLKSFKLACAAIILTAANASSAIAQSDNREGASDDWSYFRENGQCWATSAPTSVENTRGGRKVDATRGAIQLFVTFTKGGSSTGEVAFSGGYSFKKDFPIKVQIGSSSYTLYPDGEWAWAEAADDSKITASMKRGATAVITASSARPTLTKDTFSLKGFTNAVDQAQALCK